MSEKIILAGDVGGTKTLLYIAAVQSGKLTSLFEARFDNAEYQSLNQIVGVFLNMAQREKGCAPPSSACFGLAGPITGTQVKLTNLPWLVDAIDLADEFNINNLRLINDFEAVGYGIEGLPAECLETLQTGMPYVQGATRAVIGAGTGLGEGIIVWNGSYYAPLASEGGHVDFAPTDDLQIELLRYLRALFGRASYERVLSGPGLVNIYNFLRDRNIDSESALLKAAMDTGDSAAEISKFALEREDKLAMLALETFTKIYGAQAGNIALTALARGGVYIAGGIAPKIIDYLKRGPFLSNFIEKGRYKEVLQTIPVHIVLTPKVGLMGAAMVASRL